MESYSTNDQVRAVLLKDKTAKDTGCSESQQFIEASYFIVIIIIFITNTQVHDMGHILNLVI